MRIFCKIMGGMHKIADFLNTEKALYFFCILFGFSKIYAVCKACITMLKPSEPHAARTN